MTYYFFCINLWNKFIFLKEQKFTHKNVLFNRGSKSYILQLITRTKLQQKQHCGIIEPSDIYPPFCIGLETYAEAHNCIWRRQWWSWQPRKPCWGQLCPWIAKAEVKETWFTGKDNLPKHSKEKDKYNK